MMRTSGVVVDPTNTLLTRLAFDWQRIVRRSETGCWCEATACWCADLPEPDGCVDRLLTRDERLAWVLLARARRGDAAAGRVVLQALIPMLDQYIALHGGRLDEMLGLAWERIHRHEPRSCHNVMTNLARSCRRTATVENHTPRPDVVFALTDVEHRDVMGADELISRALKEGVFDSLTAEVLHCVYVEGRTSQQTGRLHQLSAESVRARASRGVAAMRERYARPMVPA